MLSDPQIIKQGQNYLVKHGDDSGLFVEFFMHQVENKAKSTEAGRPIFEDREYICIRIVGDNKTVIKRPVRTTYDGANPPDTERWPRQYQAFKNQQSQVAVEGTPINEWAMITKSDAMSMKALNIHTVEQLAALGENAMGWLGARQMRDKAKAWLESAKEGAGTSQLMERLARLEADNTALKNQLLAMGQAPEEAKHPKKRGPKPKGVMNAEDASGTGAGSLR